jgi:hypothetical protein
MNFTFTWILDKFGFQPKIEIEPIIKPVAKKATKVAKKTTKSTVPKATTRTKK